MNQQLYLLLPQTYFSHKWLKMLPRPAVHSFNPPMTLGGVSYIKAFPFTLRPCKLIILFREEEVTEKSISTVSETNLYSDGFMRLFMEIKLYK